MLKKLATIYSFRFSTNYYANQMYKEWKINPHNVSKEWQEFFSNPTRQFQQTSSVSESRQRKMLLKAYNLINQFQFKGHELAQTDALSRNFLLDLKSFQEFGKIYDRNPIELEIKNFVDDQEMDIEFTLPEDCYGGHRIPVHTHHQQLLLKKKVWTLRTLEIFLRQIFSNKIGFEYMHITSVEQKKWLTQVAAFCSQKVFTNQEQLLTFYNLTKAEAFNSFLYEKFKTSKRFGVQGIDTLISGLNKLVQYAANDGFKHLAFGTSHRGRLNTLANVFQKPLQQIFAEFIEIETGNEWGNSGDVKYHLGCTTERQFNGKKILLSILPNPSHLQAVNSVTMGNTKAVQDNLQDENGDLAMGILIHGDASVAGQGIVYQCLQMQNLKAYSSKGIIHIIANNQIGFTTTPAQARTGLYCTDVAKAIQAPIFHVNADDPNMVDLVMELAYKYRKNFKKPVFIDIIGYRRYGHNQQDQPMFTQPMMYKQIYNHKKVYDKYSEYLIKNMVITEQYKKKIWDQVMIKLQRAYAQSKKEQFDIKKWAIRPMYQMVQYSSEGKIKDTGVKKEKLQQVGFKITSIPKYITMHPTIQKIMNARYKSIQTGEKIDFATAQALAFGTLLSQGYNIRFSGQDIERGTFSHRHAYIVDQNNNNKYLTFSSLLQPHEMNRCQIHNSMLSEYGCLGFQFGYSLANPNVLVAWQAQFGDFCNGAQVMIDNYISSSDSKWGVTSGICLLLPHGMDGQGPQHSSARIQRFLQLMNDDLSEIIQERKQRIKRQILNSNLQVINPSFAANYFHALRRQMRRVFRRPLICLNSKKLLKKREAFSSFDLMVQGHRFFTVMPQEFPEQLVEPSKINNVFICSGQIYYDIIEQRRSKKRNVKYNYQDIAVVRVQQVAPFPYEHFKNVCKSYKNAKFYWFQEQHKNSGAWNYLKTRIQYILQQMKSEDMITNSQIKYIGRKMMGSTATGSMKIHNIQNEKIMQYAFKL